MSIGGDSGASTAGMEDGFKACLIRPDAPHIELLFQLLPAGERYMKEDNPVARHRKFQGRLVETGICFFGVCETGAHTRVRHVRLDCNMRSRDRFARGVG